MSGILIGITVSLPVSAQKEKMDTISWKADAVKMYDTGFMNMVRKSPEGGVSLWNIDLIENDSPGAGNSEKGVYNDMVWGQNRARKILTLDDPRSHKATLYVFPNNKSQFPLTFSVNGHNSRIEPTKLKGWETVRWVDFPPEWLKKGENVIELSCPEAKTEKEGWNLQLARADEYEAGGGDPKNVGKTSLKSTDGGKTWKESPFGPGGKDRAEYCVRLSLERSVSTGWLASPVIDLWRGDGDVPIARARTIPKIPIRVTFGCSAWDDGAVFHPERHKPQPLFKYMGDL